MHLPRGTFHSIKKKVSLKLVLTYVLQSQFSGILNISGACGEISLVLRQGQVLLAEYTTLHGTPAYDELSRIDDLPVDAELSILNDVQLGMAMEYNRSYTVTSAAGTAVFFAKKNQAIPAGESKRTSSGTIDGQVLGFPVRNPQVTSSQPVINDPTTPFDGDLNALDTMDLEKMAGKIRDNAKHIAKNLNLDHLVAEENQDRVR